MTIGTCAVSLEFMAPRVGRVHLLSENHQVPAHGSPEGNMRDASGAVIQKVLGKIQP